MRVVGGDTGNVKPSPAPATVSARLMGRMLSG
jgi:hypothetical protein